MNKVKYLAFYENWRMNKKWCTPEEWYELEDLIFQLRFDGIDTKVEDIKNPKLQMIWNNIRPSLLKSNRDKRYNDNKKSALQEEVTSTEFDIPKNPNSLENEIKEILSPSNGVDIDQPQPPRDNATESLKTPQNEGFEELLKIEKCRIDNIIDDFKAGGIRAKIQAPNRLKELTNTIHGKKYEQELKTYIQEQVYAMAV